MSASASLLTRVGSAWYSAWARSGGLPALAAVSSLVTSSSPCAWLLAVTWMLGWAAFHCRHDLVDVGHPGPEGQLDLLVRRRCAAVATAAAGEQERADEKSRGRARSLS